MSDVTADGTGSSDMRRTVNVADRPWLAVFTPTPGYLAAKKSWQPWEALAAGLLFTAFLAGYLFISIGRAWRIERLVKERTRNLAQVNTDLHTAMIERQKAEAQVRESEERYRVAIEHSNDGVALYRGPGIIYGNRRFLDMFGYESLEEVQDMDRFLMIHPDDRGMVAEYTARRQRGEPAPSPYECKAIGKSGATMNLEVSVAGVIYLGEPASLAYLRDITEGKKAKESLRTNEKRLQTLMDAAPVGVSWSDTAGNIVYCNRKFTELFGYTLQDIPTIDDWRSVAYPDPTYRETLPRLVPAVLEAQRQGRIWSPWK